MIQKSTVRSDISCLQRIPDTINDSHKKIMKNQICKQIGIWTLIAGTLGTLAVSCAGQAAGTNSSQPHFAGQAPGEKQAILRRIEGTVSAMDSKGMTLTVKLAEGSRTFKVSSKTKFTRNAVPASMKDIAVGKPVEVVVKKVYGQPDEIATVDIKSPLKN